MDINPISEKAQKGDKKAEEELFGYLSVRFRSIAGYRIRDPHEAEEACQEALKTIFEKYTKIDFEGGFLPWAYKVLDNKIRKRFELKGRRDSKEADLPEDESHSAGSTPPPDPQLKAKLIECLKKVGAANRRYARVIVLQFQGYRADEICNRLEVSRNNLYVLVSRSKSLLKLCLETGDI